jgi:hypothetical protein
MYTTLSPSSHQAVSQSKRFSCRYDNFSLSGPGISSGLILKKFFFILPQEKAQTISSPKISSPAEKGPDYGDS